MASSPEYAEPGTYTRRVLRIHDGTGGVTSKPHVWHYDDNTLTVMVPLVVPGDGTGHFGALQAHRQLRRTLLNTVGERLRNDEYPHPGAIDKFNKAPDRHTYPLVPGELLVFIGHRTLHSPLPWPVGRVRANIVFHFGQPERPESGSLRALRAMRNVVGGRREPEATAAAAH
jgi:hypothetical protein